MENKQQLTEFQKLMIVTVDMRAAVDRAIGELWAAYFERTSPPPTFTADDRFADAAHEGGEQ